MTSKELISEDLVPFLKGHATSIRVVRILCGLFVYWHGPKPEKGAGLSAAPSKNLGVESYPTKKTLSLRESFRAMQAHGR